MKDVFKFKQTFEEYTNKRDKNWYDEYVEKVNAKYNSSGIDCKNLYINLSKISNGANNYLGITRDHEQNIVNKKFDEMSEHEEFEENEIIWYNEHIKVSDEEVKSKTVKFNENNLYMANIMNFHQYGLLNMHPELLRRF